MDLATAAVERGGDEQEPQVDVAAPNVDVIIAKEVPTVNVEVRNATGRVIRVLKRVDKSAIFALPAPVLRGAARIYGRRPSGKVLIFDAEGKLLARFADATQANRHLKACGIDAAKLAGFPKPEEKGAKAEKGKK